MLELSRPLRRSVDRVTTTLSSRALLVLAVGAAAILFATAVWHSIVLVAPPVVAWWTLFVLFLVAALVLWQQEREREREIDRVEQEEHPHSSGSSWFSRLMTGNRLHAIERSSMWVKRNPSAALAMALTLGLLLGHKPKLRSFVVWRMLHLL